MKLLFLSLKDFPGEIWKNYLDFEGLSDDLQ